MPAEFCGLTMLRVPVLENLGFRAAEAARAVAEAERDLGELPTPTLIREALKRASR